MSIIGAFAEPASASKPSRPAAIYELGPTAVLQVERIGPEDGLAHNAVQAIVEDRDGFLWLGTEDGLQRYDGVELETFRSGNAEPSLSHSRVEALLEGPDGSLWIGTAGGLDRMTADRLEVDRIPLAGSERAYGVSNLALSPDGSLTVGTADNGLLELATSQDGRMALEPMTPTSWAIGEHVWQTTDRLWIWFHDDGWQEAVLDRTSGRLEVLPMGPRGTAASVPDGAQARQRLLGNLGQDVEGWLSRVLSEREGHYWWLGAIEGLFLQPVGGGPALRIELQGPGTERNQLAKEIHALELDRAGTLWIGTYGGLYKADPAHKAFERLPLDLPPTEAVVSSLILHPADPQRIFAGTYGGGVLEVSLETGRLLRRHSLARQCSGPSSDYVSSIAASGRTLAIATGSGLCLWSVDGQEASTIAGLYRTVVVLPDGNLLASGLDGTALFDPTGRRLWREEWAIGATLVRSSREVWMAELLSSEAPDEPSVWRLDPKGPGVVSYMIPRPVAIYDLAEWRRDLLIATSDGLMRFAPESGRTDVTVPGEAIGTVYSIQPQDGSVYWLGTSRGLIRLDLSSDSPVLESYDVGDGIGNVEFNRRARLLTEAGSIYLGGMSGITAFEPEAVRRNPYTPPIRIKRTSIEGRDGTRRGAAAEVVLRPGDLAVSFDYAALSFTRADRNRYRYRLDGVDHDWVEAGTQRSVRYAGLRPGSYSFEVLGSNNDGVWSVSPASVQLLVRPPFHATWWFRAMVLLVIAIGLAWIYRARVQRLLAVERMRLRIATDLHDELGGELSGIALASAIVRRNPELSAADQSRLQDVELISHRMMEGLRDIVWYVNPDHDRSDSLIDRIRSTADRLRGDLDLEFHVAGVERSTPLDMRTRRQLYLMFKELFTNAVRHSGGSRVGVDLTMGDGSLALTIVDDGAGIGEQAATDGSGLSSVRRRACAVGGSLELVSSPGHGTKARVSIPVG